MTRIVLICDRCGKEASALFRMKFTLGDSYLEYKEIQEESGTKEYCRNCITKIIGFAHEAEK